MPGHVLFLGNKGMVENFIIALGFLLDTSYCFGWKHIFWLFGLQSFDFLPPRCALTFGSQNVSTFAHLTLK